MSLIKKHIFQLPPFSPEQYVKCTVAGSFWKDSNDLLWRATIYRQHLDYDSRSTKSKTYVDIIMAMECAMKSMILSLSSKSESPEDAYRVARKCSHNLEKLYSEVKMRAKNRVKLLKASDEALIIKANTLGVNYRYDITSFMLISQEDWADRGRDNGFVSSVINHAFISKINTVAVKLSKLAGDTFERYLGWYQRKDLAKWDDIDNRHQQFLTNLGTKF